MTIISNIVFAVVVIAASWFFARNVKRISRNINLGRDEDRSDRPGERWGTMARVALGQSKMVVRPIAGFLHIIVYAGFVIINLSLIHI